MKSKDVFDAYQKWAQSYDEDSKANVVIQAEKSTVIDLLHPLPNDKILEIGCGTARLTIPIARSCLKITGVDFSEAMIEIAKRKAKGYDNIRLMTLDANNKLPFRNSSFDKVVCSLVLNHIEDLGAFFRNVQRVAKKEGIFVFDDIVPEGNYFKVRTHTVLDDLYDSGKDLFCIHSQDDYVNSLTESGFSIEETKILRFDESVRPFITVKTFQLNKGHIFGWVMRARRE